MISVVLPTYNRPNYLRDSIESVLAQTIQDWELIVVDDCSTDETYSIIKENVNIDKRIRLIRNDKHLGLPLTLNRGFSLAKGEYLTWTSDDNKYKPEALSKLVKAFSNEDIGLVFSGMDIIDAKGRLVGHSRKVKNLEELHYRNIVRASFMYTRRVYDAIGEYDITKLLVEDYDYWIRISRQFSLKYLDESLYFYRIHQDSLSTIMRDQVLLAKVQLLEREIGFVSVGKEHRWEVVEHEAEVVRQAFYMAGMCYTYGEIAEELTRMEKEDGNGRIWNKAPVVNLLRSETYIGNYLSNKECRVVDEYGVVKRVKNKGQVEQILIEEHHPALVSKELYGVVQELLDNQTLGGHRRKFSAEEREIMDRAMKLAAKEAESWRKAV